MNILEVSKNEGREICAKLAATGQCLSSEETQDLRLAVRDQEHNLIAGLVGITFHDWLYVSHLWVDKPVRLRGHATRLLRRAMAIAAERGCGQVHIETRNRHALALYRKLGFTVAGSIPDFICGEAFWFLYRSLKEERGAAIRSREPRMVALDDAISERQA